MISVVGVTFLLVLAFSLSDFQGYSDLYPLLPYAALGFGGTAAAVLAAVRDRPGMLRAATATALVAVVALTALTGLSFARERVRHGGLATQRADACALDLVLGARGTLYALGNPTQLVLTHRRNPDRFVYLNSAVDKWRIKPHPRRDGRLAARDPGGPPHRYRPEHVALPPGPPDAPVADRHLRPCPPGPVAGLPGSGRPGPGGAGRRPAARRRTQVARMRWRTRHRAAANFYRVVVADGIDPVKA